MSAAESAENSQPSRPLPRIVRVPPPVAGRMRLWVAFLPSLVFAVGWVIALVVEPLGSGPFLIGLMAGVAAFMAFGLLAYAWEGHSRRRSQRLRARFLEECPDWDAEPVAVQVARLWKKPDKMPEPTDVREVVSKPPRAEREVAWVICLGIADVPPPGDMRFEPEVISPWSWWAAPVVGAVHVALVAGALYWYISSYGVSLRGGASMACVVVVATFGLLLATSLWWRLLFSPTYLRLAPGMIQFLTFPARRRKPVVRSYAMTAGTVAMIHSTVASFGRSFSVSLIDKEDDEFSYREFSLSGLWHSRQAIERMWQALLSTAPTPPLSDEGLVG